MCLFHSGFTIVDVQGQNGQAVTRRTQGSLLRITLILGNLELTVLGE